jgi:GTPase
MSNSNLGQPDVDNVTIHTDEGIDTFLAKYRQLKLDQDYEGQTVMADLPEERYYGNHEYKLKLVNVNADKLMRRTTQMKFRMEQGRGEALYEIGVHDNGKAYGLNQPEIEESLIVVYKMAKALDADLMLLYIKKGEHGEIAQLMIRQKLAEMLNINIKILLLGDTTSGKSTLLGVMVSGRKDDGRGLARKKAFENSHTLANGNECTVNQTILGFDISGIVTNMDEFHDRTQDEIRKASYKVVSFIDIDDTLDNTMTCIIEKEPESPNYVML